jgi:hypothetical protein
MACLCIETREWGSFQLEENTSCQENSSCVTEKEKYQNFKKKILHKIKEE